MRAAGRLRPRSAGGRLVDSTLPSELPAAVIKTARRPETGEAGAQWPGSHPRLKVPSDAQSATRRSKCHPTQPRRVANDLLDAGAGGIDQRARWQSIQSG